MSAVSDQPPPPRTSHLGINTETMAGMLVAALLAWVGLTTHTTAVDVRVLSAKLDIYVRQYGEELEKLEDGAGRLRARVRALEEGTSARDPAE